MDRMQEELKMTRLDSEHEATLIQAIIRQPIPALKERITFFMDRADLELVLAIREQASLSAAALRLDVAPPVVSKRLAALEAQLGQKLFQRTTRRVSPTAEGETMCDRARVLLQGFATLEAELQERKAEPTGLIRLAATLGFGRLWLGPALAHFQAQHPRLEVQLQLTEQLPDLAAEGFDGAIWLWSVQGRQAAQWVTRRLARNQRVLVAAPSYLRQHGTPATLDALQTHRCLIVRENGSSMNNASGQRFDVWPLQKERDKQARRVRVAGPLSSNSGELVRDWCLAGHGIMLRSLWDIAPQLAQGQLIRVLPEYAMPDADIHWLAPHRADAPRRIRLLVDFLIAQFRDSPWKTTAAAPARKR
jgi:LysR family transcriptional activator of dmlA